MAKDEVVEGALGVRAHVVGALEADLVGPYVPVGDGGAVAPAEVLPLPPSRWYLTGFLAPEGERDPEDADADAELDGGNDAAVELDGQRQEPEAKQRNRLPASMGLSVFVGPRATSLTAEVSYADYVLERQEPDGGEGRARDVWRRVPHAPARVEVPLDAKALGEGVAVPDAVGLRLKGAVEPVAQAEAQGLEAGTRAVSVFLVNERGADVEKKRRDEQFVFQVGLALEHAEGFVPRPDRRGEGGTDWDARVADLQFRHRFEHAVGHGVSVAVDGAGDGPVTRVRTAWIPRAEVKRVRTRSETGVETSMDALAALPDGSAAARALTRLPAAYGAWIAEQRELHLDSARRRETRDALMDDADRARQRIEAGIALLAEDADALEAFRAANRAMAMASRQQRPEDAAPSWRLFQLAFVLLNLRGVAQPTHADRDNVELIFFPTGGGKTEAYLGLIAFALVLRRLRGRDRPDQGLGVAVLLRYTLRLLTLDQLGRAATLVCALERIRQERPGALGEVRFACGLWVGRSAAANTMAEVQRKITDYKNSTSADATSPFPLTACPWCATSIGPKSFFVGPTRKEPTEVTVGCLSRECPFSAGNNREGLPVLFVDEQIYRELPAFVVATVDKFAMMPWRGETGMLFGRAHAREGRACFGPMDRSPKGAVALPEGLLPPELIVQDELHLISGPLGTMVGLYETAIEALCSREMGGHTVRPKIVASTATVRRAGHQVRALFARQSMALFPPPGPDESETFFAEVDGDAPGRQYIGVAASGRSMKQVLLRVYVDLLAAAQRAYDPKGPPRQPADAYMTVAGYFNSLRELGGMRRLVEDEVRSRAHAAEDRRPLDAPAPHRWLANRTVQPEPVELTSRETTGRIADSKARLAMPHAEGKHVDVLLASNMISVGVDIDRLGLMVVAGQPKTTSEYIQASSRVGRQRQWPGLVVTCFNLHKPRDRSHYERFTAYHESFYRFVEAQSLTPFSGPALDRGLAGTLVAMTRLMEPALTPSDGAMLLPEHRRSAERWVEALADRAARHDDADHGAVERLRGELRARCRSMLDSWERLVAEAREGAGGRRYSPFDKDKGGKPLLSMSLGGGAMDSDEKKFVAATSMRDVEPTVHLWVQHRQLGGRS
jgi:hypothetical protein